MINNAIINYTILMGSTNSFNLNSWNGRSDHKQTQCPFFYFCSDITNSEALAPRGLPSSQSACCHAKSSLVTDTMTGSGGGPLTGSSQCTQPTAAISHVTTEGRCTEKGNMKYKQCSCNNQFSLHQILSDEAQGCQRFMKTPVHF